MTTIGVDEFSPKDVNDIDQFTFNYTDELESGDTIASVAHSVSAITGDASPLAIDTSKPSSGETYNDSSTSVWLKLGTEGNTYWVTSQVTTANGRTLNRRAKLKVTDI